MVHWLSSSIFHCSFLPFFAVPLWWHPTKSPLVSIYTGIKAVYWTLNSKQYQVKLTQYHQVPPSTTPYRPITTMGQPVPPHNDLVPPGTNLYWPSTTKYQPVSPYTDPVSSSTNWYHFTIHHFITHSWSQLNLFSFYESFDDSRTVYFI